MNPSSPIAAEPPPRAVAALVRLIGEDMTIRLLELHGGTEIYVPRTAGEFSLARELSAAALAALVGEYGGIGLVLPLCKPWRARIYRARGMSHTQIALRLGCTERTVTEYVAGRSRAGRALPTPTRQLNLL